MQTTEEMITMQEEGLVITAASDGAVGAVYAVKYLETIKESVPAI